MSDYSRRQAIRNLIAGALATASSTSLIEAALAQSHTVTVKATNGREIRIRTEGKKSSVAEIVDRGKVVDSEPSGTFMLPKGKTIVLSKGQLVGGDAVRNQPNFAMFALLPRSQR